MRPDTYWWLAVDYGARTWFDHVGPIEDAARYFAERTYGPNVDVRRLGPEAPEAGLFEVWPETYVQVIRGARALRWEPAG